MEDVRGHITAFAPLTSFQATLQIGLQGDPRTQPVLFSLSEVYLSKLRMWKTVSESISPCAEIHQMLGNFPCFILFLLPVWSFIYVASSASFSSSFTIWFSFAVIFDLSTVPHLTHLSLTLFFLRTPRVCLNASECLSLCSTTVLHSLFSCSVCTIPLFYPFLVSLIKELLLAHNLMNVYFTCLCFLPPIIFNP